MSATKILSGLREALSGDFASVTVEGVTFVRKDSLEKNIAKGVKLYADLEEARATITRLTAERDEAIAKLVECEDQLSKLLKAADQCADDCFSNIAEIKENRARIAELEEQCTSDHFTIRHLKEHVIATLEAALAPAPAQRSEQQVSETPPIELTDGDAYHAINVFNRAWGNKLIPQSHLAKRAMISVLEAARAALSEAAAPAQDWRPIEEAPKDGNSILALTKTRARVVVFWRAGGAGWLVSYNGAPIGHELDLWMPLPSPPGER